MPDDGWAPKTPSAKQPKLNLFGVNSEDLEKSCLEANEQKGAIHRMTKNPTQLRLQRAWGSGNSWQIYAVTPTRMEENLSRRAMRLLPPSEETPAEVLQRFEIGAVCTKGKKATLGQDNLSVSRFSNLSKLHGGWKLYMVADGHGEYGDWVSDLLVRTLPYFLSSYECRNELLQEEVEKALELAFKKAEEDLIAQASSSDKDLSMSGATTTAVLKLGKEKKAWVATIGDSRAIFFDEAGNVLKTSKEHKPQDPAEKSRIEEHGGEVKIDKHNIGRVFKKDRPWPALAVTRAFGDLLAKNVGVSVVPEIECWDLENHECGRILIASDGIWEFLSNQQVAATVSYQLSKNNSNVGMALETLVEDAQSEWQINEGNYCDDVTVLMLPAWQVDAEAPQLLNRSPALRAYLSVASSEGRYLLIFHEVKNIFVTVNLNFCFNQT
jgi:serine/threonine protein phosphatase PrpC